MIKSIVSAPFIPISSIFSSHRGSQGVIYGDMIYRRSEEEVVIDIGAKMTDDFNKFDRLYVYHGNDWGGSINLYGGLEKFPYAANFLKLSKFKGEVISLAHEFPDYNYLLGHKIQLSKSDGRSILPEFLEIDFDNVLSMQKRSRVLRHPYITPRVTVGDSHGISMYRSGWTVNSVPFKTLHGALKTGLFQYVIEPYELTTDVEEVELYFGNIDIRHHVCMQPNSVEAVETLVREYVRQASELRSSLTSIKKITICELLPIEDESRVIPKTGMYKGKGFWGSWAERNSAREHFNDFCEKLCVASGVNFKRWTNYLLNKKGQLDTKHMEYKRSVHLSRMSYPHWQGTEWNDSFLKKIAEQPTTINLENFMV